MLVHGVFAVCVIIFGLFFRSIGTRPFSAFSGLVLLAYIVANVSGEKEKEKDKGGERKKVIEENSLLGIRIILLTGITIILHYFGLDYLFVCIGIISLSIFLRFYSYLKDYEDGKLIFQVTYILSTGGLFFFLAQGTGRKNISEILLSFVAFNFAIYSFITFIIGSFYHISHKITSTTYILFHIITIGSILYLTKEIQTVGFIITQIYIMGIYWISGYVKKIPEPKKEIIKITATDILHGKRVIQNHHHGISSPKIHDVLLIWKEILKKVVPGAKSILYVGNIILIAAVICSYILRLKNQVPTLNDQIFYRISIAIFFINFLIIKRTTKTTTAVHRVSAFIIINFAVYINLIYLIGEENRNTIIVVGILRNFANALVIGQSNYIFQKGLFGLRDYYYRITSNIGSLSVNIVILLRKGSFPRELTFGITFIYVGLFFFLTYYNMQYINQLEEKIAAKKRKEEMEQKEKNAKH